jgi:MFS transporter, ACS family, glucarate transporter
MITSSASHPSSRRVLLFASTLAMITYVDRVCIAQAAPYIQADLGLTKVQMGLVFSAFAWAYAIFEIPGGWLGDWIGPRRVLLRIVVVWSCFTALTGYAWGLVSMLVARFIFGAGEAGCFPNLTKAFTLWLPAEERVRAQSILWFSARWAGAFTPLLVIWVMTWLSWRNTFVLFGAVGLVWAWFFARGFPKDVPGPAIAPARTGTGVPAPVATRPRVPWNRLLRSRSVWLLWAQYFCLAYGWFFYVTWLPTYLAETRGLQLDQNAVMRWLESLLTQFLSPERAQLVLVATLAGVPLFFGGFGSLVCGWITPRLTGLTGSMVVTRRWLGLLGFGGAGVLLVGSFYLRDPLWAMLAMGLASLSNDLTMPGSWGACMDIGGSYAGTLSGSMNMMGSIGAALAPLMIGYLLDHSGQNWALVFWISGVVYLAGGLCWLGIHSTTPIASPDHSECTTSQSSP